MNIKKKSIVLIGVALCLVAIIVGIAIVSSYQKIETLIDKVMESADVETNVSGTSVVDKSYDAIDAGVSKPSGDGTVESPYLLVAPSSNPTSTGVAAVWNWIIANSPENYPVVVRLCGGWLFEPEIFSGAGFKGGSIYIPEKVSVLFDLNGNTIDRGIEHDSHMKDGSVFTVEGELTIIDSSGANAGTITGGGTYYEDPNGWNFLNPETDIRKANKSMITGFGGGVYVNGGTFNLMGGTITGCEAVAGGGVAVDEQGIFRMYGGAIKANYSFVPGTNFPRAQCLLSGGGGVFVYDGATFEMHGGSVSKNFAKSNQTTDYGGGGILVMGKANVPKGTSYLGYPTVADRPGNSDSKAYIIGAVNSNTCCRGSFATGNTLIGGFGGGILCWGRDIPIDSEKNASVSLFNGNISYNSATYGGGICVRDGGELHSSDDPKYEKGAMSIIYNNTTTTNNYGTDLAGGIAVFASHNTKIYLGINLLLYANTAAQSAGIYIEARGNLKNTNFTFEGIKVYSNTTKNSTTPCAVSVNNRQANTTVEVNLGADTMISENYNSALDCEANTYLYGEGSSCFRLKDGLLTSAKSTNIFIDFLSVNSGQILVTNYPVGNTAYHGSTSFSMTYPTANNYKCKLVPDAATKTLRAQNTTGTPLYDASDIGWQFQKTASASWGGFGGLGEGMNPVSGDGCYAVRARYNNTFYYWRADGKYVSGENRLVARYTKDGKTYQDIPACNSLNQIEGHFSWTIPLPLSGTDQSKYLGICTRFMIVFTPSPSIKRPTLASNTIVYDGNIPSVTFENTLPYVSSIASHVEIQMGKGENAEESDVGINFVMPVSITTTPNYDYFYSGCGGMVFYQILPKTVGIEWDSETEYEYSGKEGHGTPTVKGAVSGDEFEFTYRDTAASGVVGNVTSGEHTRTVTDLGNRNYVIDSGDNPTKTYRVTAKTVEIDNTDPFEKTYDGSVNFSDSDIAKYGIIGKVPGDDLKLILSSDSYDANASNEPKKAIVSRLEGTDASNYRLKPNTFITYIIKPRPVELEWSDTTTEYTGLTQFPTVAFLNKVGNDDVKVTIISGANTVGKHTLKVRLDGDLRGNYTVYKNPTASASELEYLDCAQVSFTINPRPVKIEWDNDEFTYNGNKQIPTPRITNLVSENDSCETVVVGEQIDAGTGYVAEVNSLKNTNYTLEGATGKTKTFKINPRQLTLVWGKDTFAYDRDFHSVEVWATNAYERDGIKITTEGGTRNAGTATVKVKGFTANSETNYKNYTLPEEGSSQLSHDVTVTPVTISFEWTNRDMPYNGFVQLPKVRLIGILDGDSYSVVIATKNDETSDVFDGSGHTDAGIDYAAKIVGLHNNTENKEDENYIIDPALDLTTTYTIRHLVASLSWDSETTVFQYDGQEHAPTVRVDNLLPSDTNRIEAIVTGAKINAGTHSAVVSELRSPNYVLDKKYDITFVINPKPVEIVWQEAHVFPYVGAAITVGAQINNLVLGDSPDDVRLVYDNNERTNANPNGYVAKVVGLEGAKSDNYSVENSANKEFNWEITAVPLTITAKTVNRSVAFTGKPVALVNWYAFTATEASGLKGKDIGATVNSLFTIDASKLQYRLFKDGTLIDEAVDRDDYEIQFFDATLTSAIFLDNNNYTVTVVKDNNYGILTVAGALTIEFSENSGYSFMVLSEEVDEYGDSYSYRRTYSEVNLIRGTNDGDIEDAGNLVIGQILPNTPLKTFMENFSEDSRNKMALYDIDGNLIYENGEYNSDFITDPSETEDYEMFSVGTGWSIVFNGNVIHLSVIGDLDGSGMIDASDYSALARIILGRAEETLLRTEFQLAAMLENSGTIDASDYSALARVILGRQDPSDFLIVLQTDAFLVD